MPLALELLLGAWTFVGISAMVDVGTYESVFIDPGRWLPAWIGPEKGYTLISLTPVSFQKVEP